MLRNLADASSPLTYMKDLDILNFNYQSIDASWSDLWTQESQQSYFVRLTELVNNAYGNSTCFPPKELIFNAFRLLPLHQVRVVILGQDPYHQPHQAHGLSFSVPSSIKAPPSLRNILTELKRDPLVEVPITNNLSSWAEQGVLLLNSWLTVEANRPASHSCWGWEQFTDACIRCVSDRQEHAVFMLWGAPAQRKRMFIREDKHQILIAPHPSPLSAYRGFIGCNHFSLANQYLTEWGFNAIDWGKL
jgi:uracil-DNA glycosylase